VKIKNKYKDLRHNGEASTETAGEKGTSPGSYFGEGCCQGRAGCSQVIRREQITGAGEPSSRSSNLRYFFFFFAAFLAFFFAAMLISLRVMVVGFSCKQLLFLHSQNVYHVVAVTPVSFPIQDFNAWCANSKLRSKKNATLL
jgi:hypothetical protein